MELYQHFQAAVYCLVIYASSDFKDEKETHAAGIKKPEYIFLVR